MSEALQKPSDALQKPVDANKIKELLDLNDGARIKTWLSICSRCGLCAESCFFYLAKDKDPKLSPAYKVRATLGEIYRRKGKVDREFLQKKLRYHLGPVHDV